MKFKPLYILLVVLISVSACTKEKTYEYQVSDVKVRQPGTNKPASKSTLEFISIAYYDLFGSNISQDDLLKLNTVYSSFGDKKLIEDMIIRNFLKRPGAILPLKTAMRSDVNAFVEASYKKFYNRLPSQTEKWFLNTAITSDTSITPELVYFSLLTSNEYRHY